MHILLINHYGGSPHYGPDFRPYYLAKEWVARGHEVSIVAATESHLRYRKPAARQAVSQELINGIRYVWVKSQSYRGNGFGRAMNIFVFVTRLITHHRAIIGPTQPGIVIGSSTYPLDCYPAKRMARAAAVPMVYEVHDLWPLSPIELGGMSCRHPFVLLMQWAENFACRNADRVVSLLPKAEDHLRAHGMRNGNFSYVPNGIDVEEWRSYRDPVPGSHQGILDSLKSQGRFLIGYTGAHGIAIALDAVVEAAHLVPDVPVTFVLVGQGAEKERLQRRAGEMGLSNLMFLPPVPKASMPALLGAMDAVYIGLQKQPLFRFGVSPNKLMDYMMAAKPVISAIEAGNDIVAESGCGLSVEPENPPALAAAVKRMMSFTPQALQELGQRGQNFILRNLDYRVLADRFLSFITPHRTEA